ncbi:MAG: hypothetical protein ACKVS9_09895 [Phycisphaerae bacterium]
MGTDKSDSALNASRSMHYESSDRPAAAEGSVRGHVWRTLGSSIATLQHIDPSNEHDTAASMSLAVYQGRIVEPVERVMKQSEAVTVRSRIEARAWWLARQSGWVLVGGLLAASVANGLIVAVLVVLDHLTSSSIAVEALAGMTHASLQLIWLRLHPDVWYGPAEIGAAVAAVVTSLTLIVCGAISLTRVHRQESIAASFHRCMAGLIAITPAIALALLSCGLAVVSGRAVLYWNSLRYDDFFEGTIWIVPIAIGVVRVTRKMADITDATAGPPPTISDKRCEDCGYDLSGHVDLPRCGECGSPTASSLTPGLRRWPNAWQLRPSAETWFGETIELLLSPSTFYAKLRIRDSLADARTFGRIHFIAIGIMAMCWLLICAAVELSARSSHHDLGKLLLPALVAATGSSVAIVVICASSFLTRVVAAGSFATTVLLLISAPLKPGADDAPQLVSLGCFAIAIAAPLVCWLGQRINGTVAALPFLGRDGLPDGRWAETVIAYESAFCWFFCIGWGLLVWSYFAWDDWISRLFGTSISYRVFGLPPEIAAIAVVALVGGLIWQIRFRIAYRAVRWANE